MLGELPLSAPTRFAVGAHDPRPVVSERSLAANSLDILNQKNESGDVMGAMGPYNFYRGRQDHRRRVVVSPNRKNLGPIDTASVASAEPCR